MCSVTRGLMIRASPRYSHDPARGRWPGRVSAASASPPVGVDGGGAPGRGRGRLDNHLPGGGRSSCPSAPETSQTPTPSPAPATPQFSPSEVDTAKQHRCQVFDVSVRGQEGQGGLRVEGNLNVPMVLRTLNSATACRTRSFRQFRPMLHRQHANTSAQRWTRQRLPRETRRHRRSTVLPTWRPTRFTR